MIELALQWLAITVLLVVLNGASQQLPWGVGSAKQYRQRLSVADPTDSPKVLDVSSRPIVTSEFDEHMASQVSTLTTDRTFSWIVSKPLDSYRPGRYVAREVLTQALVAVALVALLALVDDELEAVMIIAIAASATALATYGQLANWWGLTRRYSIGVSVTLVASWVAAAGLVALIW